MDAFNDPPLKQEDEMNNNYEAAEVIVIGEARNTILGIKDFPAMDNRVDENMFHRDDFQVFDE